MDNADWMQNSSRVRLATTLLRLSSFPCCCGEGGGDETSSDDESEVEMHVVDDEDCAIVILIDFGDGENATVFVSTSAHFCR
jgi:hypothetical protein